MPDPLPDKSEDLLESWKEIAAYMGKGVRTVVRWEKTEGLPVQRHIHERRSSIFASKAQLDAWWESRRAVLDPPLIPTPSPDRATMGHWRWLVGALLPIAAVAIWQLPSSTRRTADQRPFVLEPLTSYPGSQYGSSFAPDGNHFAFVWEPEGRGTDIYVQAIGSSAPKRLTDHPDVEFSPAWSPDGKSIAFLRRSRDLRIELLLIPSLGGAVSKLADVGVVHYMDAPQVSWSPDGKWLAFSHRQAAEYGIFALSPESGEVRRLTVASGPRKDLDASYSPDGNYLAFRRGESEAVCEIYLQVLTADGAPSGVPQQLTRRGVRSTSPVWSGDSRRIFFSSGVFNSATDDIFSISVTPRQTEAQQLTNSRGDNNFSLSAARRGGLLAFARRQQDLNIWEMEHDGVRWKTPQLVRATVSTRREQDPALSPDANRIAFISDRTGHTELWVADRAALQARKLTSFEGPYLAAPRWSPDGAKITFSLLSQDAHSIWTIDAAGGVARKLIEPGWSSSWSSDGQWIYFSSPTPGSAQIFRIRDGGGAREEITNPNTPPLRDHQSSKPIVDSRGWEVGAMPISSPDGTYVYWQGPGGFWRLPAVGGRGELAAKVEWLSPFAPCAGGLVFHGPSNPTSNRRALLEYRFADGSTREIAPIAERPPLGLATSPDCKTVLFSQVDQQVTNLIYVRGLW